MTSHSAQYSSHIVPDSTVTTQVAGDLGWIWAGTWVRARNSHSSMNSLILKFLFPLSWNLHPWILTYWSYFYPWWSYEIYHTSSQESRNIWRQLSQCPTTALSVVVSNPLLSCHRLLTRVQGVRQNPRQGIIWNQLKSFFSRNLFFLHSPYSKNF